MTNNVFYNVYNSKINFQFYLKIDNKTTFQCSLKRRPASTERGSDDDSHQLLSF